MGADSTELTFVRCPHCRSLVPAASKTCRMCGESLEAGAKSDDSKTSRVRQRTMTKPSDELTQAASRLRDEPAHGKSASPFDSTASSSSGSGMGSSSATDPFSGSSAAEIDDPLGAYIQEISMGEQAAKKPAPAPVSPPPIVPPVTAKSSSGSNSGISVPPAVSSSGITFDIPIPEVTEPEPAPAPIVETPPSPPPAAVVAAPVSVAPPPPVHEEPSKPKVIVETGNRRAPRSGAFSFSRPKSGDSQDGTLKADKADSAGEHEAASPAASLSSPIATKSSGPFGKTEKIEKTEKDETKVTPVPSSKKDDSSSPSSAKNAGPAKGPSKSELTGRLVGWLVSYSDPDGYAHELREGKFFVSKSTLKPSDFIIEDESISTPHAIVVVTGESLLRVQDLMSERGVFVRSRGADAYQRAGELVEVHHGDWLRFGDVEFLICLIENVGQK